MTKRLITEKDYPDITKRFMAGDTIESIANLYKCEYNAILYHVHKMKLVRDLRHKCGVSYCTRAVSEKGMCSHHQGYKLRAPEDLNHLIPIRPFDKYATKEPDAPPCDHTTSRCECINKGMYYKEYILSNPYK